MRTLIICLFAVASLLISCQSGEQSVETSSGIDQKVEQLLTQMTIEEKVGQMTQINLDVVMKGEIYNLDEPHTIAPEKLQEAIKQFHVGSVLNCGGHGYAKDHWINIITAIQQAAVSESRLGIPVLYGIDAIHGANYTLGSTLFPQQLAQAATFNPDLVEQAAKITAYEVRASGIPWNFSPVLDLGRQPLWSRFFETYGEDVFLAKAMGVAAINGYQGDGLGQERVAACMKHFVGYSFPFTGKDRTPVYMGERHLREYYLPTFEAAVAAGAKTFMVNSGEINGVPVHADKYLLTDVLRGELGFQGVVVTDWEDIMKLYNIHHVAHNNREAVKIAIDAGIDMSMVPNDYAFTLDLIDLVKTGEISEERIDASVRRILKLKFELGLFDVPVVPQENNFEAFGSEEHAEVAYQTALQAITLLKNDKSTLPLGLEEPVLVTGPAANSLDLLNGAWSRTWQGGDTFIVKETQATIWESIRTKNENAVYFEGSTIDSLTDLDKLIKGAQSIEKVIVCLGERPSTEKPGDIDDLEISDSQIELVESLLNLGKKVVIVLVQNRPQIVSRFIDRCDAVVLAYQPGSQGARALVELLYGQENFSGKLPFTYPEQVNDFATYDHKATETLDQKFGRTAFDPQWEFGYGLSYSELVYKDLKLSAPIYGFDDQIEVTITIENKGAYAVKESVLAFVKDEVASITPSVKRLRAFTKVDIQPKEEITINLSIPVQSLSFVGLDKKTWVLEPGAFQIMVGNQQASFSVEDNQ